MTLYAAKWILDRLALEEKCPELKKLVELKKCPELKKTQVFWLCDHLVFELAEFRQPPARVGEVAELGQARLVQVGRLQPARQRGSLVAHEFADGVHFRERDRLDLGVAQVEGLRARAVYRRNHEDETTV